MRKRAVAFIAGTMAVGLIAAGCGSSDPSPIAKAAFVKQASAICATTVKKMETASAALIDEYAHAQGDKQQIKSAGVKYVSATLVPDVQTELDEIHAVGLPRGDEEEATQILESIQEVVDAAQDNPEAYPSEVQFKKSEKLADGYGLESCPVG